MGRWPRQGQKWDQNSGSPACLQVSPEADSLWGDAGPQGYHPTGTQVATCSHRAAFGCPGQRGIVTEVLPKQSPPTQAALQVPWLPLRSE